MSCMGHLINLYETVEQINELGKNCETDPQNADMYK